MSLRSDLMLLQKEVAKKDFAIAIDPSRDNTHDVSSHAIAKAIYDLDTRRVEGITTRDRVVVYAYVLRKIEQGEVDGTTPEEVIEGVRAQFYQFVDDFEEDPEFAENYGKPFGGIAVCLVELLDVTQIISKETKGTVFKDPESMAIEVVADYIELTRNNETLYELKEKIESTL